MKKRLAVDLSPDAAIASSSEDLLGRTEFATAVADTIGASLPERSLVIAINGGWGSGKSSIKNMVVERLEKTETANIVEFNPWEFSGEKQLAESFFHDVGLALGVDGTDGNATERIATWNAIATRLSGGASAIKAIGKVLGMAGVPMADIIASGLSTALKESGEASKGAKQALEEQVKLDTKTLSQLKKDLREKLPEQKVPLLVVIDDIDRLTSDEVCLLFRMVKANADFQGLIFLLLFDRLQVIRALDSVAKNHGEEFLEKIVQVSFDVPDLSPDEIASFAEEEFYAVLKQHRLELKEEDSLRWQGLYSESLAQYFTTLRSVRRYLNSLKFHFALFQRQGEFEVNPVDLALLEALRVFENTLYRTLPRHRSMLMAEPPYLLGLEFQREQANQEWSAVLENVPGERRSGVDVMLRRLFPYVATGAGADSEKIQLGSRRVAHPKMFDAYFRLALPTKAVFKGTLARIERSTAKYDSFKQTIDKHVKGHTFDIVLEHLSENFETLAPNALVVTQVLIDISDQPSHRGGWPLESNMGEVTGLIRLLISRDRNVEERANIVIQAINQAKGLHIPFLLFSEETKYRDRWSSNQVLLSEPRLPELKSAMAARISVLTDQAFWSRPDVLPWKLRIWQECGAGEDALFWIIDELTSASSLIRVLKAFSDNSRNPHEPDKLRVDLLSQFVMPPDVVEKIDGAVKNCTDLADKAFLMQCRSELATSVLPTVPILQS